VHWAIQYIGKPWTRDGFGPESFHCWGLVVFVSAKHYNVTLPKYGIDARASLAVTREMERASVSHQWTRLNAPTDGCVVAMSEGTRIRHVGIFLNVDGGRVLHACEKRGVVCEDLRALRAGLTWNRIEFYTYGANH
jgi:cell wall-associated NlpC family hydrolase